MSTRHYLPVVAAVIAAIYLLTLGLYMAAALVLVMFASGLFTDWQTARDRFQPRRERKVVQDG